jgi:hypothetical protein
VSIIRQGILFKDSQVGIALFLAGLLEWLLGMSGSDGHPRVGFPIHLIDQIAITAGAMLWLLLLSYPVGGVRGNARLRWLAINGIRLEAARGLASFRMRATWAKGAAKRAIHEERMRKERLGRTAMSVVDRSTGGTAAMAASESDY